MENAIANHEFEKAHFYTVEEHKERENMRQLREKYNIDDSSTGCIAPDDIEDVVARWTGVPMTSLTGGRDHQAAAHRGAVSAIVRMFMPILPSCHGVGGCHDNTRPSASIALINMPPGFLSCIRGW